MYEELIQRLGNAAGGPEGIKMAHDAADAIAALQSENAELRAELKEESSRRYQAECNYDHWYEQGLQQQAALSRVEAERDAAVADLHSMHTLCMDIGGCCPECGSQIDELLDAACTFCKGSGVNCWENDPGNGNKCAAFEWRGAQGEA